MNVYSVKFSIEDEEVLPEEDYEFDIETFIRLATLDVYKEEKEQEPVLVFSSHGSAVLGDYANDCDEDAHYWCDAASQELEYIWSALTDARMKNAPLVDAANNGKGSNVYYMDSYRFADGTDEKEKIEILGLLAALCGEEISDNPDCLKINVIAYYPRSLQHEKDRKEQVLTDIACAINSSARAQIIEEMMGGVETDNYELGDDYTDYMPSISITPEMYLRAAGMRVSGVSYPESAKNRFEWDLFEKAGWEECGNSRLLFVKENDGEE